MLKSEVPYLMTTETFGLRHGTQAFSNMCCKKESSIPTLREI